MSTPLESYKGMLIYKLDTSPEIGETWYMWLDRRSPVPGIGGPFKTVEAARRSIDADLSDAWGSDR